MCPESFSMLPKHIYDSLNKEEAERREWLVKMVCYKILISLGK
jgi:hypothetical protein